MNFLAAFLLGLAGSLHCAVMCGPLLLAVNASRRQIPASASTRFFFGDVLPNFAYHGGRLATYGLLGSVSGLIGAAIVLAGFQRWVSIVAGGLVLLASITSFRAQSGGWAGRVVLLAKKRFSKLLHQRTLGAAVTLGALNGFLPCGLVYVACAAAASTGRVSGGIVTMLGFGLGTAPMMLSVGLIGRVVRWGHRPQWPRVALVCAAVTGVLLIVRGLSLGIPYLSPHYIDGQGPACACHRAM